LSTHARQQAEPKAPAWFDTWDSNGWLMFAGVLLLMLGTLNFVEGGAAIGNSSVFIHNAECVTGNLSIWGWIMLCIGVVQWVLGVAVWFLQNQMARWVGIGVLSFNAIAQLLMMPASPYWSLPVFALDVVAIYGLVVHGERSAAA